MTALGIAADPQPAQAFFAFTLTAGAQVDQTATLSAPSGLTTSAVQCSSSTNATAVALQWDSSTNQDADGNYLVGYYGIWRSTDDGPYALIGSTSGLPPADAYVDDSADDNLPSTVYLTISGDTLRSDYEGTTTAVGNYGFGAEENLIAGSPDGSLGYVAESGPGAHNVLEVGGLPGNANFGQVASTIDLAGSGAIPIAVTMAPDGNYAYALDEANDVVDIIPVPTPGPTYTVPASATIPVGRVGDPAAMAVTPGSDQLLVANYQAGTVTIANLPAGTVAATVPLPLPPGGATPAPSAVAVSASGDDAYVLDSANHQVDMITLTGPEANEVTSEVTVGAQAGAAETPADMDIAQSPSNGTEIYVGNPGSGTVSMISASTEAVSTINLGRHSEPTALTVAPDGCYVAVAETVGHRARLVLISAASNTVMSTDIAPSASTIAIGASSGGWLENYGAVTALPTAVSYELQAGQTTSGGGFMSALSLPVTVSLGRGEVP